MTEKEAQEVIHDNPIIVAEVIQFWIWMNGLNKLLKWLAIIGLPIAIAGWGIMQWFKKH